MIYEYRCDKCEHVFERMLKIDDRDNPKSEPCPNCGETGGVQSCLSAPMIGGFNSFGGKKINRDFQQKLEGLKKAYPGSTINDAGL